MFYDKEKEEENYISNREFKNFMDLVYKMYSLNPTELSVSIQKLNSQVKIKISYNFHNI